MSDSDLLKVKDFLNILRTRKAARTWKDLENCKGLGNERRVWSVRLIGPGTDGAGSRDPLGGPLTGS